ncbi:MAG: hypothetical protein IIC66_10020 [candidate division Zixibacteria bacterium]|nr:hypothetical protein [candidate division Zixibacteria bacterium]
MHNFLKLIITGVLFFCVCILGITANAATIPQSTEQLVENSSDVIRGRVISQISQWNETHTTIYTDVTIEITEIVFGSVTKGATISVYVPGGIVNDTGLRVEHSPEFEDGEEVILFLTELDNLYSVTSWEMGKFRVENANVVEKNLPVSEFITEIKAAKR